MVPAGRWRTGFAACWRRTASSSARCSAVRWGFMDCFMVGFMTSPHRFGDVVGSDRADNKRIIQVQHVKHDGDKPAGTGAAKGNRTAGRLAHIEGRVSIEECRLNFLLRQAMVRNV